MQQTQSHILADSRTVQADITVRVEGLASDHRPISYWVDRAAVVVAGVATLALMVASPLGF